MNREKRAVDPTEEYLDLGLAKLNLLHTIGKRYAAESDVTKKEARLRFIASLIELTSQNLFKSNEQIWELFEKEPTYLPELEGDVADLIIEIKSGLGKGKI